MLPSDESRTSRFGLAHVLLGLIVVLLAAGCRPRGTRAPFDASNPQTTATALERHLQRHPHDDAAWRDLGHVYWLHLGRTEDAVPIFDRLARAGDPVAHLSRLLIAEARLDVRGTSEHAYALLSAAAAGNDPFVDAAAEVAARRVARDHGDRPGDDDRFVELFGQLPLRELPYSVQQPLISTRASIARRKGKDYKEFFQREGCVQNWAASPVLGTLGDRELSRLERGPWTPDPEAQIVPLSCAVRVWNPTIRSGIRRLRTVLDVRTEELLLDVSGEQPLLVYVDDRLIHRTDVTDHYPGRRRRLALTVSPGAHVLEVVTAVPGENVWILVRATEADGAPVASRARPSGPLAAPFTGKARTRRPPWPAPMPGVDSDIYTPLRQYLAIDAALSDGETDLAESLVSSLGRAERFAEGHLLRSRFERADPSRTSNVSASREQRALETSLSIAPDLDAARLRLLEVMLSRGEDAEVTAALRRLPKGSLRGIHGEMFRHRAQSARGNEHLALEALKRAAAIHPQSCEVLMAQRSIARERDDVRTEDAVTKALADCAGSLRLRARLAETRGHAEQAAQMWAEMATRAPDDIEVLESLARLAALDGDFDGANAGLQRLLELNPFRIAAQIGMADLAVARGDLDGARGRLRDALERVPHSDALRRAAENLGIEDDLMRFRVDGLEALAAYRTSGVEYPGVVEVLVLDRSVARVYDGGGQRQIVHLVVHLLSKEALDRYGEVQIPDGARLLRLRSIKPDGRMFEPEIVPGKDGVELRKLEVGDFVEYEFIVEQLPATALPSYVDVSTFRFQSLDIPYHRSELVVVAPTSMPLRVERRNGPPEAERTEIDVDGRKLAVLQFGAREVPRLGVEPGHRHILEEVPNLRVYTDLDVNEWLENLGANLRYAQRANPELRRRTRGIVRGKQTDRDQLEALWTWVVENVEQAGDLASPATATLAGRTGNRLMLLRAMLNVIGIDSELWLARDAHGPADQPGGHPLVENYDAALLAVHLRGDPDPLIVTTTSEVMPMSYLAPGYATSEALRVPLSRDDRPGRVRLPPRSPELEDRRVWSLDITIDAGGSGTVEGTITLQGMEAALWRQALRDLDEDRVEEAFQQAELGWLRGATLDRLEIRDAKDLSRPLVLAFTARAPEVAITQSGSLVLRSAPLPLNLAARYTALPRRVTGMVVPYAPLQEARISFTLQGARFTEVPRDATIASTFGRFTRTVEQRAGAVELRYVSELRTGVVEPADYGELADFARKVETEAQGLLRAQPR